MTTTFAGGPIIGYCVLKAAAYSSTLAEMGRDSNLDIWTDPDDSIMIAECTLSGGLPFPIFSATLTAICTLDADYIEGNVFGATLTGTGTISGTLILLSPRKNWIMWAKTGSVDFTKDKSNKSGDTPLDWKGYAWAIKVLNDTPVVYGENGVSILTKLTTKFGVAYGYKTIYDIGLKGKGAVAGDKSAHYFIDAKDQMWKLSDKLELLDYSEFLSTLTDNKTVMSMNIDNGLIYICDGTYGYIYNTRMNSMTSGPINVSGIGNRDGSLYIVAPATISIPGFEKWTDIHDMKTRKSKTIEAIEVGVDISIAMQASIEWRVDKATAFSRLPWRYLSPLGIAPLFCHGVEFRFGLKTATYASFEIDHINIIGVINDN